MANPQPYTAPSWLLHGSQATQYIARLHDFKGGAGEASYVQQKQSALRGLVKDHQNFADAVLRNPLHPFESDLEFATAMSILRHASSKTEAQEQIDDHKRLEHEGSAKLRLKDMLDKVAQHIPKYASLPFRDTSHCVPCLCLGRGQMAAFSVPLEKTPIPTDLLRELRGLSDGTLEAEYFVWSSPLLQLQQKLLDYHSAGHVHWVFAEQLNKLTGVREFAGIETADVAIELQKLLCKNPKEQVCLLGLYADKTALSGDGRTSGHGVYLEFLNLHTGARHSLNGPMFVGSIPIFKGSSKKIQAARLRLYHWCMALLVEDIKAGCEGLEFSARFGTLQPRCSVPAVIYHESCVMACGLLARQAQRATC